jgi:hypothetical protein
MFRTIDDPRAPRHGDPLARLVTAPRGRRHPRRLEDRDQRARRAACACIDDAVLGHLTGSTVPPERRICSPAVPGWYGGRGGPAHRSDVAGGATPADFRSAVAGLGSAIELVDIDRPFDDVEAIVAGNIFHRAVSFGPVTPAGDGSWLRDVVARIVRNGEEVETIDAAAAAGNLVEIVRFVADTLAACGQTLRAGDRIIAGSLGRLVFVEPAGRPAARSRTPRQSRSGSADEPFTRTGAGRAAA